MNKNRALKIMLWVLLGIVGILVVTAIVCTTLAFQDNYADKYTIENTSNTISISDTLVKAAWKGEETTIPDEDINQWLFTFLNLPKSTSNATLNHLAIHNSTDFANMYFQITYKGSNFAICSKIKFSVDTEKEKIYAEVQDMKIGELGIPHFLIPNILQKVLSSYSFLTIDGNTISFNSYFKYNSIDIKILELNSVSGGLHIKTNALKQEAIEYIEEKVTETIEDWTDQAKEKIDEIKDNFQSYMEDFQEEHPDEASSLNEIKDNLQTYVEDFKEEHADEISGLEEKWGELEDTLKDYWNDFKNGTSQEIS